MPITKITIIGLVIMLALTSCRQSREIPVKVTQSKNQCQWGFLKATHASTDRYFDGTMPAGCFPGLSEFQHIFIFFEAKVYNRWGMVMFETKSMDENWICNQGETQSIPPVSYFFTVKYQERASIEVIEETGLIVIDAK